MPIYSNNPLTKHRLKNKKLRKIKYFVTNSLFLTKKVYFYIANQATIINTKYVKQLILILRTY